MPAVDECASLANETTCGTLSYCRWQTFSVVMFQNSSMLNGSSTTYPASSTATNGTTAPISSEICKDATCTAPTRVLLAEAAVSTSGSGFEGMPMPGACVMDGSRHPCSQANDATSCMGLKDFVGRPRCMAQARAARTGPHGCSRMRSVSIAFC